MKKHLFLFLFLSVLIPDGKGQSASLIEFINCVEQQNGIDNLLLNGRPYYSSNTRADGHPYFQTKEWRPGVIYIHGNSYPVNSLKYNLSNYQLVVKQKRQNGTSQKIVLSDLLVDSFQLGEHLFVNQNLILTEKGNSIYLERIFVDKFSFYRAQKKRFNASYNVNTPYGKFDDYKPVFYLVLDGKQQKITKKKEFLSCFPVHYSKINKYLKDNPLNWKKMTNAQLFNLLKFCNDQI